MNENQSWRDFILVSIALCIGTIGTALASPLYPIYQELWGLNPSDITFIFVSYMLGCLTTLLFLGRTSNTIGYVKTMQLGLIFITIGLLMSIFASDVMSLSWGRFIIGIASGLMTTSALIGLIQTVPTSHKQIAPQLSSIITAVGFGLGPLFGGFFAEFFAYPLVIPYVPIVIGSIFCFFSLFTLKPIPFDVQKFNFAPKLLTPQSHDRTQFFILSLTAFAVFAGFSLYASLSPSFVKDILPWHGPLISGSAITVILLISAATQFFSRSIKPQSSLLLGIMTCFMSVIALFLCMEFKISWLFFLSDGLFGIGHGLALLGAFGLIHHMTTPHNRAAVMSTYLFIGYLGTILPILAVGYLADHFGLTNAVIWFCIAISILLIVLFIKQMRVKSSKLPLAN